MFMTLGSEYRILRTETPRRSTEANEPSDRLKLLVRRGANQPFDRVIELDDLLPNWCHRRAAAIRSSLADDGELADAHTGWARSQKDCLPSSCRHN